MPSGTGSLNLPVQPLLDQPLKSRLIRLPSGVPVQQCGIDTKRMPKLEGIEVGFQRMTEEDCCWRDEMCQEVCLNIGESERCFGKLFGRDARPSERISVNKKNLVGEEGDILCQIILDRFRRFAELVENDFARIEVDYCRPRQLRAVLSQALEVKNQ